MLAKSPIRGVSGSDGRLPSVTASAIRIPILIERSSHV
jgi:hypothetical protein